MKINNINYIIIFALTALSVVGCNRKKTSFDMATFAVKAERQVFIDYAKAASAEIKPDDLTFQTPKLNKYGINSGVVYDDYIIFIMPSDPLDSTFAVGGSRPKSDFGIFSFFRICY